MAATLTATAPARPRKLLASRRTRVGILYALPVVVYLLVLFVYPIFSTLLLSLKDADGSFTLHWYADALTGVNLSVLITTLRISAETAAAQPGLRVRPGQRDLPAQAPVGRAWPCWSWSSRTSSAPWCAPTAGSSCSATRAW